MYLNSDALSICLLDILFEMVAKQTARSAEFTIAVICDIFATKGFLATHLETKSNICF